MHTDTLLPAFGNARSPGSIVLQGHRCPRAIPGACHTLGELALPLVGRLPEVKFEAAGALAAAAGCCGDSGTRSFEDRRRLALVFGDEGACACKILRYGKDPGSRSVQPRWPWHVCLWPSTCTAISHRHSDTRACRCAPFTRWSLRKRDRTSPARTQHLCAGPSRAFLLVFRAAVGGCTSCQGCLVPPRFPTVF